MVKSLKDYSRTVLDSLSSMIAVIDREGTIIEVNRAWEEFGIANGAGSNMVGNNYLAVCDSACGDRSAGAPEAAEGIRSVLSGEQEEYTREYPCPTPEKNLWFLLRITRAGDEETPLAIVSHEDITDRKEAEQALRESEDRYRRVVQDQTELVSRFLPDGSLVFVNEAFCRFYNRSEKELLSGRMMPSATPVEFSNTMSRLRSLTPGNPIRRVEHKVVLPNGEQRHLSWTVRAIFSPEGELREFQSVGRDVTAQKISEETLRESESRYYSLFMNNHATMLLIDPGTGLITDANPSACDFYGYSREKLRAMHISEINTGGGGELSELMQKAVTGDQRRFSFRHRLAGGEIRDVEVHSGPIRIRGKELLYSLVDDITERKRAEQSIRESETFIRSTLDSLSAQVVIIDDKGVILHANKAWKEFSARHGATGEEQAGPARINYLELITEFHGAESDFAAGVGKGIREVIEGKRNEFLTEFRCPLTEEPTWYQLKAGRFVGDGPLRVVIAQEEITQRKKAEKVLEQSRDQLERLVSERTFELSLINDKLVKEIGERIEAEKALRESEENYRSIFDNANDAFSIHDFDTGLIIDVNKTMCEMYGYSKDEMKNADVPSFSSGENPYTLEKAKEKIELAAEGEPQLFEWHARKKDGTLFWVEVNLKSAVIGGKKRLLSIVRDISERREAEQAIRRSEDRYRTIFQSAAISIWEEDCSELLPIIREIRARNPDDVSAYLERHPEIVRELAGRIKVIDVNDSTLELYGAGKKEQLIGSLGRIMLPESFAVLRETLAAMIRGESIFEGESVNLTLDGRRINILLRAAFLPRSGDRLHTLITVIDITERKQIEEALRKSEAGLAEAQRIAHLGSWEWGVADNEIIWSDETFRIFGLRPGHFRSIIYEQFLRYIHPDDRDELKLAFNRALFETSPFNLLHRIIRPDGEERTVQSRAEVITAPDGSPERILGTLQDITVLKKTEEALLRERSKLELTLKHQSLLASVASQLNIAEKFDEVVEDVLELIGTNMALENCCFYSVEEGTARSMTCWRTRQSEKSACARQVDRETTEWLVELFQTMKFVDFNEGAEHRKILSRLVCSSADKAVLACPLTIFGKIRGFVLFRKPDAHEWSPDEKELFQTLTEMLISGWERDQHFEARLEAEHEHAEAAQMVEKASRMASIGVMAAGIIHEINQPLNAIKLTADSVTLWIRRNSVELPEKLTDQIQRISAQVGRIDGIVRHMREFWISPAHYVNDIFELNQAVGDGLSLVDRQLTSHGIDLVLELSEKPLRIRGNKVHLEQSLINLVVNAMHALDDTSGDGKLIRVTTDRGEDQALLEVIDNGPGIPEEDMERLFDPFYSKKEPGKGMGLGLAIVERFVKELGGSVRAANNPNGGARFIVCLPLHKES